MLQRKQTIYLFLAIICFVVCATTPLGTLAPEGMGISSSVNCIGVVDGDTGALSYPFFALPLFFTILNVFHSLAIIFMYKNRKTQALNCYIQVCSILVETIASGALIYLFCIDGQHVSFKPGFALCMPIISMIFLLMAHKGIMDDERLIRSVDRIR